MEPIVNKQKAVLIRKYHTLCSKIGLSDEAKREMLLSNYNVESSKELHVDELQDLCKVLQEDINKKAIKLQEAQNRVFGAVGGWLDILYGKISKDEVVKKRERSDKIKAIACRQTGIKDFNKIPIERLKNVSFLFSKKQKDFKQGELLIIDELQELTYLN